MVFACSFVVGWTPFSDTLETERMIAPIQHSELFASCKDWFKAHLTVFVVLFNIRFLFCTCAWLGVSFRMEEFARVAKFAVALEEELTDSVVFVLL